MKRLLCFVISCVMLISSAWAFAEEAPKAIPEQNMEYMQLISDLGLLDGELYEDYPTRIMFAEILSKAFGSGELSAKDTPFGDVKSDDKKSGYVQYAADNGFLKGFADANFRPYDYMTYYQAMASLVRLTGHDGLAQQRGGYPVGYLWIADQLHITRGVSYNSGDDIVAPGDAARMVYNAISADIMEISAIEDDNIVYKENPGKTLLSEKMEIYELEGRITETYLSATGGKSNLSEGKIRIDKTVYTTELDMTEQLGKNMTFYIKRSQNATEKVLAVLESEDTNEVSFDGSRLVNITDSRIEYMDENDRKRRMDISVETDCVFNGQAKTGWSASDVNREDAYIRLLDNNGDGECDIIFVEDFTNMTVTRVNTADKVLYLKAEKSSRILNLDEPIRYIMREGLGDIIDFEDIKTDDLLSVAESADKTVYILRRSTEKVSGTINAINDDEVKLDDTLYPYDSELRSSLSIGAEASFVLDFLGRIASVSDGADDMEYGYLLGATQNSGISKNMKLKLFAADGTVKILEAADRIRINDTATDEDEAYEDSRLRAKQLIRYSVNGKGEVSRLEFAVNGSSMDKYERLDKFTLDEDFSGEAVPVYYRNTDQMFAHRLRTNDDMLVIIVPEDPADDEGYSILRKSDIPADLGFSNAKVYDLDENYYIGAIVANVEDKNLLTTTKPTALITRITKAVDENGDDIAQLHAVTRNSSVVLTPSDDDVIFMETTTMTDGATDPIVKANGGKIPSAGIRISGFDLEPGDIIQYNADNTNTMTQARVLFRANYAKDYTERTSDSRHSWDRRKNDVYSQRYTALGEVKEILDSAIVMDIPDAEGTGEKFTRVYNVGATFKIIRFNPDTLRVEETNISKLYPVDKLFVHCQLSNVRLLVVYE